MYGQSSFAQFTDECATLKASGGDLGGGSENVVVITYSRQRSDEFCENNVCATLSARDCKDSAGAMIVGNAVRKLTPLECERLQGLPDGYTEGGSDTARYKAIGNGMAQPCADYIMAVVKRMVNK